MFVLIIEAKKTSVGQAMKQIFLAMKDANDNNKGSVVYGFVTTRQQWQMLIYDGTLFKKLHEIVVVFDGMDKDKRMLDEGMFRISGLYGSRIG